MRIWWRGLALALSSVAILPSAIAFAQDPLRAEQWNLDAVGAEAGHRISIGSGVLVAVIDSGVEGSHPDLAGSVIDGRDFIDGAAPPDDQHGHGTNVAGIIAARAGNAIGITGAAPGAKILAIRVLDANNVGNSDQQAAGIDAAVAGGAQVINLSLSVAPNIVAQLLPLNSLVRATERAVAAGVVVVAAAGNDSVPLCAQPVLATKIICVGAVNRSLARASYSNYGLRVDIVAPGGERHPGEAILSTQLGGGYGAMAGTSQATPHVAAAAALLVSLGLRGRAVIDRLEQTATPLGNRAQLGHGMLNMGAAVAGLGEPLRAAPVTAKVRTRLRYATVRRRGLRVTCTSPRAGTCRVRVTHNRRLIARGSRKVGANAPKKVRARLTRAGRRAMGRSRRIRVRLHVSVAGVGAVRLRSTLVR